MKKDCLKTQSIHNYLELLHRQWYVELDVRDFRASISSLLQLPIPVYDNQARDFFLTFLNNLLLKCSICFIQRETGHIDLALIGNWNTQQLAIPLWIINDELMGFDFLPINEKYEILDSFPLIWKNPIEEITTNPQTRTIKTESFVIDNDLFISNTVNLRIEMNSIVIANTNPIDELKFFERIASTIIPEIDDED